MVPFADNANHQTTDNQYEIFNSRLAKKVLTEGETALNEQEKNYLTSERKRVNFLKHFKEDDAVSQAARQEKPLQGHSLRYARKVEQRHQVQAMTPGQLMTDPEFIEKDIWELRYASTSDNDDNDSESSEYDSEEDEDEEEEEEEAKEVSS